MKIGILGLGSIGARHARNLVTLGHSVYAFDPEPNALWAVENNIRLVPRNAIWDQEAVVIATPSCQHLEDLTDAAAESVHVFIEKPIATSRPQEVAGRLMNIEDNGKIVFVGLNLRFHSCVKKAKAWLDAGLIGEPMWANFTIAQHSEKYDDLILNWASHEIDLATYLLGPARVNTAVTGWIGRAADIVMTHDSGSQTVVHADYLTNPERRSFMIAGIKGNLHVDLVERFAWIDAADLNHYDFTGEDSYDENYVEEMRAFMDRIDGKETIGCTGAEGLAVLEICLEAKRLAGLS